MTKWVDLLAVPQPRKTSNRGSTACNVKEALPNLVKIRSPLGLTDDLASAMIQGKYCHSNRVLDIKPFGHCFATVD